MSTVLIAVLTAVALTASSAVGLAPAAAQPSALPAPAWQIGDEWTYRWESPRGKGTFTWVVNRVEALGGVEYYVVKGGGREIYWRKSDLAFHLTTLDTATEERAIPPRRNYVWPLVPGQSWDDTYTRERPLERQSEELTIASRVEGAEAVSVPGGTFQALKVTHRNARTGAITSEWWYAPEVKSFVRQRIRYPYGIMERVLAAFRLGGAPAPTAASPPPVSGPPPLDPKATIARGEFTHRVTYRVTGTAGEASITYRNEKGGTQQSLGRIPWELTFDARAANFLYVSAQNRGASGSVSCDILVDGMSRTTATSTGAYVVAECSEAAGN